MPNDDTSYYADLNPDNEEENRVRGLLREAGLIEPNPTPPKPSDFPFEFPATFEVAESEPDYYLRLVGSDQEHTIDKHPVLDPGDEVTFFEHGGKARLSVSKKTHSNEQFDAEGYGEFLDEEVFEDGSPNHADLNYQDYLWDILSEGHESDDRTGTGTVKSFGHQMRFDLQEGFPLLTSKTIDFENVARELLWFLRGRTNVWHLLKNDVHIWTGNAYARYKRTTEFWNEVNEADHEVLTQDDFEKAIKECDHPSSLADHYENFAGLWGDLGEIYGARWRDAGGFDQIENLVEQLQDSPDSRRLRVDAWKPSVHMKGAPDEDEAALPPCHYGFQCFTRELSADERVSWLQENDPHPTLDDPTFIPGKERHRWLDDRNVPRRALSLKWNQRSVDSFLGLPYNIASYGLLTHLLAHRTGMVPEEVIFSGGDCHVYQDHLEQVEELLSRTPRPELPQLKIGREEPPEDMGDYQFEDLSIQDYHPHPKIEAPLAV